MNYSRVLVVALALGALAACQPKGAATGGTADTSPTLATVNGTAITQNFFNFYIKAVTGKEANTLTQDQRSTALDNLVRAQVVAQQALKENVDKIADTQDLLELTRLFVLLLSLVVRFLLVLFPSVLV